MVVPMAAASGAEGEEQGEGGKGHCLQMLLLGREPMTPTRVVAGPRWPWNHQD